MRISYPERRSEFLLPIENAIRGNRDALFAGTPIMVKLPPGGYSGNIRVTIEEINPHSFWTDWEYEDPSRFPRRIRVAAWALFRQGCFGEFEISHNKSGFLTIRYISGGGMCPSTNEYYVIIAKHSGKCLDVGSKSTDKGAKIIQWDCWGGKNQQWKYTKAKHKED